MIVQNGKNTHFYKILCLIVVLFIASDARKKKDHPVFKTAVPSEWQTEPVVILADTVTLDLKKSGKSNVLIMEEITWYKINKPSSGEFRTFIVPYYKYLERKPTLKVQAVYKGNKFKDIHTIVHNEGLVDKWSRTDFKSGKCNLQVSIPDYSNILYLRIEVAHYITRLEEFGYFLIRHWDYNTVQKNIILTWPLDYTLNYGLENEEGIPISVKTAASGKNMFSIEAKNVKEQEKVARYKYPELWFAALFVSFPPKGNRSYTWEEFGRYHFESIYDSLASKDTSILDKIACKIPGGTQDEITKNAFQYVQENIRY